VNPQPTKEAHMPNKNYSISEKIKYWERKKAFAEARIKRLTAQLEEEQDWSSEMPDQLELRKLIVSIIKSMKETGTL
jgi:hypothetical protein